MRRIVIEKFGGPEVLQVVQEDLPAPGPGQVRVRITSIGMNHADLMARRGEYKIASGDPPFTPGLEAGGEIDAVGPDVADRAPGERVTLDVATPRRGFGSYVSHVVCDAHETVPVPDVIPETQIGALWLAYLTAWGCLIWKQQLQPGQTVAIPAASSAVAMAAAQIVKQVGGTAIGLTTNAHKLELLRDLPEATYDHLVLTRDRDWYSELKTITDGRGVDVFFDPVAAGPYLETEIRALAPYGTIWIYGLLGKPAPINIHTLIRKRGAIRGWVLSELVEAGRDQYECGYDYILDEFARGNFIQHVAMTFHLDDVRQAHDFMEKGEHIGKLVLVP